LFKFSLSYQGQRNIKKLVSKRVQSKTMLLKSLRKHHDNTANVIAYKGMHVSYSERLLSLDTMLSQNVLDTQVKVQFKIILLSNFGKNLVSIQE